MTKHNQYVCQSGKHLMINMGNVSGITYTTDPPQWDEVWICPTCQEKHTERVWGRSMLTPDPYEHFREV